MKVEATKKVAFIPAHFEVEEHRRHVGICPACSAANAKGEEVKAVIVRAPARPSLIERSIATPSLVAGIAYEKYVNSMPIARIERDFGRKGLALPRSVMANWMMRLGCGWLSPLVGRMKELLLARPVLHSDDTRVLVLKEPGRSPTSTSYMWVWATAEHDVPIRLFEYHPSRAKEVVTGFLGEWSGFLHCDGYGLYHGLDERITVVGCLAHVKRGFSDIVKAAGKDIPPHSVALEALRRINNIFHIDKGHKGLAPDIRKAKRESELRPLMESFFLWCEEMRDKALPGYKLAEALTYALNQKKYIMNVFEDGRLDLTNNACERAIKPFALCRRNFLFSDTPRGAAASAAIFSVVQTALANKLKPYEYLKWLLEELPHTDLTGDPTKIDQYLPWSKTIPGICRMSPDEASREPIEPVLLSPEIDVDELENAINHAEQQLASQE